MVKNTTEGEILGVDVTITVKGDDEQLADLIHSDLVGRAEELNEIVEAGVHPEATRPPTSVDWVAYQNGDLPRDDVDEN